MTATRIEQMRLNAPAKVRTYLKIIIFRNQISYRQLACQKRLFIVVGGLALYPFKKPQVKLIEGIFKIDHKSKKSTADNNIHALRQDISGGSGGLGIYGRSGDAADGGWF